MRFTVCSREYKSVLNKNIKQTLFFINTSIINWKPQNNFKSFFGTSTEMDLKNNNFLSKKEELIKKYKEELSELKKTIKEDKKRSLLEEKEKKKLLKKSINTKSKKENLLVLKKEKLGLKVLNNQKITELTKKHKEQLALLKKEIKEYKKKKLLKEAEQKKLLKIQLKPKKSNLKLLAECLLRNSNKKKELVKKHKEELVALKKKLKVDKKIKLLDAQRNIKSQNKSKLKSKKKLNTALVNVLVRDELAKKHDLIKKHKNELEELKKTEKAEKKKLIEDNLKNKPKTEFKLLEKKRKIKEEKEIEALKKKWGFDDKSQKFLEQNILAVVDGLCLPRQAVHEFQHIPIPPFFSRNRADYKIFIKQLKRRIKLQRKIKNDRFFAISKAVNKVKDFMLGIRGLSKEHIIYKNFYLDIKDRQRLRLPEDDDINNNPDLHLPMEDTAYDSPENFQKFVGSFLTKEFKQTSPSYINLINTSCIYLEDLKNNKIKTQVRPSRYSNYGPWTLEQYEKDVVVFNTLAFNDRSVYIKKKRKRKIYNRPKTEAEMQEYVEKLYVRKQKEEELEKRCHDIFEHHKKTGIWKLDDDLFKPYEKGEVSSSGSDDDLDNTNNYSSDHEDDFNPNI